MSQEVFSPVSASGSSSIMKEGIKDLDSGGSSASTSAAGGFRSPAAGTGKERSLIHFFCWPTAGLMPRNVNNWRAGGTGDTTDAAKAKPQNVKYDSTTGKMYEELGSATSSNSSTAVVTTSAAAASSSVSVDALRSAATLDPYLNYQNYQASYPYGQMSQVQYMGSFTGGGTAGSYSGSSHHLNPYNSSSSSSYHQRSAAAAASSAAMMYPYNTPGAFVPHSAINLSVKASEAPMQTPTTSSTLDLTISESGGSTGNSSSGAAANSATTGGGSGGESGAGSGASGNAYDGSGYAAASTAGTSTSSGKTGGSTSAVPQILDLTRPVLSNNTSLYNSATSNGGGGGATMGQSNTTSSGTSSKEQTEPVDFSSPTQPLGGFGASFVGSGSASRDSSRFRSNSSYSSFGLTAPSYNSLLQNGYSGYSSYNQAAAAAGYGCLNYANSTFGTGADNFGLSSVLGTAAAATTAVTSR